MANTTNGGKVSTQLGHSGHGDISIKHPTESHNWT